MRSYRHYALAGLLLSTLVASLPAQTKSTSSVALVDSRVFYHPQLGIQRLRHAYQQLETEFAPKQAELQVLQNRIVALNAEANKMGATAAAKAKEEEVFRLQREFDAKKQEADAAFNKRRLILVQPIQQHVGKALQDFIAGRGITVLLDVSKLEDAILAALPTADFTRAFIDEYNAKFPGAGGVATNR